MHNCSILRFLRMYVECSSAFTAMIINHQNFSCSYILWKTLYQYRQMLYFVLPFEKSAIVIKKLLSGPDGRSIERLDCGWLGRAVGLIRCRSRRNGRWGTRNGLLHWWESTARRLVRWRHPRWTGGWRRWGVGQLATVGSVGTRRLSTGGKSSRRFGRDRLNLQQYTSTILFGFLFLSYKIIESFWPIKTKTTTCLSIWFIYFSKYFQHLTSKWQRVS